MKLKHALMVFTSILFMILSVSCPMEEGTPPEDPLSSAKAITGFRFDKSNNSALDQTVDGVIAGTDIGVMVPAGTDVTALVATFTSTGESVTVDNILQASGVTANDYSGPVSYRVEAEDESSQYYTVTVVVEESRYTVTYHPGTGNGYGSVPVDSTQYIEGSNVTVADNTGGLAGVEIQDGIHQRFVKWNTVPDGSGTDRLPGSTFTITADTTLYALYTDDSEVIGKIGPAGGWIFYDAGSVQSWGRYLEAAPTDQEASVWGTLNLYIGTEGSIGTGQANTQEIIAEDTGTSDKAADRCVTYSVTNNGETYDDWFLPSYAELEQMFINLYAQGVGGFTYADYWSSTEDDNSFAWARLFYYQWRSIRKDNHPLVRAARAF